MNTEDDDQDLLNGSPDPAWGYYVLWHRIKHTKVRLDNVLMTMILEEHANISTDKRIKNLLTVASETLNQIIDELPNDGDETA